MRETGASRSRTENLKLLGFLAAAAIAPLLAPAARASSWQSGIVGDPESVGRGGAGIVLSDNVWGVLANPAGSALTVSGTKLQFSKNDISDYEQVPPQQQLELNSGGAVFPSTPWGVSACYQTSNQAAQVREYTGSVSRLFMEDHLSLGLALNYGHTDPSPTTSAGTAWGATAGAIYRLPRRILLGATLRTQMDYTAVDGSAFYHPWELGLGAGQIPNRFFRYEAGIRLLGPGFPGDSSLNLQPHLGLEYRFVDLRQVKLKLYAGSYLENWRLHGTGGLGLDFWIFSMEGAVDGAANYQSFLFGVGLDLGAVLNKLRITPSSVGAPPGGLFPEPLEASDDWLPARLQDDPENAFQEIGPTVDRWKGRLENITKLPGEQPKALQDEGESFSKDWKDLKEELK